MRPNDGSQPVMRMARERVDRFRAVFSAASLPMKAALFVAVLVAGIILLPFAVAAGLCYAPVAVWLGRTTVVASLSVALWALVVFEWGVGKSGIRLVALDPLPFVVVGLAHLRPNLSRGRVRKNGDATPNG